MATTQDLREFVNEIKEKDDFEFSVHSRFTSQDKQHIICIHRGKAKYVYHVPVYGEFGDLSNNGKLVLFAIYAEDILYLFGRYELPWFMEISEFPDNVILWDDYREKMEKEIIDSIVVPFFENLPETKLTPKEKIQCERSAKKEIIFYEPDTSNELYEGIVKLRDQDLADLISGDMGYINELKKQLKHDKNIYAVRKTYRKYIDFIKKDLDFLEKDELNLIQAINTISTREKEATLTVAFGQELVTEGTSAWKQIGETKISSYALREIIFDDRSINEYDFVSAKAGKNFLDHLKRQTGKNKITFGDIMKITYRRKVIFEK